MSCSKVKFVAKCSSTEPTSNFNKQLKPSPANAQPLASQDVTSMTTELSSNQQTRETPFPATKDEQKGSPAVKQRQQQVNNSSFHWIGAA